MIIVPKNWSSFQHYKDRSPPWIKLHKGLIDDRKYQALPVASRALAPMLWLLASESKDGAFDADVEELSFRLRASAKEVAQGLSPLLKAGFFIPVQDASSVLAGCGQVAVPETETETETETKAVPAFVLPSWIPGDTWSAYLQTRTDKRTKNGAHALGLIVKDLEAFRAAGHDPVEILNSSIKSGWAGVFAPKAFLSVVGVTVPGASGRDPALQKLDDDARRTTGPSLATLEKMAQLRGKVTA